MTTYLAREMQNIFVDDDLETYFSSSTGAEGIVGKVKKATPVTNVKQQTVMRAVQEKECQELQKAIEGMSERHKRLVFIRKQKLMGEVPEPRHKCVK